MNEIVRTPGKTVNSGHYVRALLEALCLNYDAGTCVRHAVARLPFQLVDLRENALTTRRAVLGILATGGVLASAASQSVEAMREEAREHPRIVRAIRELEDAIRYMEAAPHDFGGYKAQALADSRAAVASLRHAIAYRAGRDEHGH
ncbi:MAG: hypothetical protein JSR54_04870 [Proteobacteria bacterium]|nr:hypothetical protein [Pseudomonadota bacterium]